MSEPASDPRPWQPPWQPTGRVIDAWLQLQAALAAAEEIPCRADPPSWFASDPEDRAAAARACAACPAYWPCRDYARAADERAGVWGGRDHSAKRQQPQHT